MASIDRRVLVSYRQALDQICAGAGSATMRAFEGWLSANPGASVAEIRAAAIELTDAVLGSYGDAASSLACDLFDSIMELEGVGVPAAQVYDGVREGAVEGTVRRVVGDVDGTQDSLDTFSQAVCNFVEQETRRAANATVEKNVKRASKTKAGRNVRYARVPTRAVPCEWCAMLASRGFVYKSAERAEAGSHHHCTCTIVPGIKGVTQVAGYDPEHYADVWKHHERYVETMTLRFGNSGPDDSYMSSGILRYSGMGKPVNDTIAGVKKGSPMDIAHADGGRVNPNYRMGGGYHINCQSCVLAFVARCRGWDVQAAPATLGSAAMMVAEDTTLPWLHKDGSPVMRTEYSRTVGVTDSLSMTRFLTENVKPSRQYTLEYDSLSGGGHIVNLWADDANEIWVYDGQVSTLASGDDLIGLLEQIDFTRQPMLLDVTDFEIDQWYADNMLIPAM